MVIGRYLGQLGIVLALLTTVTLGVSLYFAEYHLSIRYLLLIALILALAIPLSRFEAPASIQSNEALAIVALAFIITPLAALLPLTAAGLAPFDALFEAVSAVTTTGLSTLATVENLPKTTLFARAWMQWYGGLGIIVFTLAILFGYEGSARRFVDSTGVESLLTTTRHYARRMLSLYIGLTALGALLLWPLTGDGFSALTHSFAALSTGGFAPADGSLAALSRPAATLVMGLALLGAIPFVLHYRLLHGRWREVVGDSELQTLLLLLLFCATTLVLLLHLQSGMTWGDAWYHGLLLGSSAQSTAGFATLPVRELPDGAKFSLIVSMFIGGGLGSTAGGIKVIRLLMLLRLLQLLLRRTALPSHAVTTPTLQGREVGGEELQRAVVLLFLFLCTIALSWFCFLLYGYPPLDALFEVVSATGTVGLSSGITAPGLESSLKLLLCLDMLLGRLEIIALLVLLYTPSWFGKRTGV
jgi:trk system potassium uptake protein TrkH